MKKNTDILEQKAQLRSFSRSKRAGLDTKRLGKKIVHKIKELDLYKDSYNILIYYPFGSELDIKGFLNDETKNRFLPRVYKNEMQSCRYKGEENLIINKWGIKEPSNICETIDPKCLDLIILPALMVDKKGYRLGYGAGFYDRFCNNLNSSCKKLVAVPNTLLIENLPVNDWDVPCDLVVTEEQIIKFRKRKNVD